MGLLDDIQIEKIKILILQELKSDKKFRKKFLDVLNGK